jgi:nucleoside-triphosphatase
MSHVSPKNVLLTGRPGCGKTTVVRRVVDALADRRLAGFYTEEMRVAGRRVGFEAIGLRGGRTVLAHVDFPASKRVGRYGVDVSAFEELVRAELERSFDDVDLFVVDEIGKMECHSRRFVEAATRLLDSPVPVLATIALKGGGFIGRAKARKDAEIVEVTSQSRQDLPDALLERLALR